MQTTFHSHMSLQVCTRWVQTLGAKRRGGLYNVLTLASNTPPVTPEFRTLRNIHAQNPESSISLRVERHHSDVGSSLFGGFGTRSKIRGSLFSAIDQLGFFMYSSHTHTRVHPS